MYPQFVHKTCQRHPTTLKVCWLIVCSKFYKICKFENHVTRNNVIMMSLPETMENNAKMRTSLEPNKIYIIRKVLMTAIQKWVTFIEFQPLCQKLWAFMSSFTMNTHQIWSCHVTLVVNFENFYFSPNFILNFRKSCQIWGKFAQEQERYRQETKLGVHPVLIQPESTVRISALELLFLCHPMRSCDALRKVS